MLYIAKQCAGLVAKFMLGGVYCAICIIRDSVPVVMGVMHAHTASDALASWPVQVGLVWLAFDLALYGYGKIRNRQMSASHWARLA